MTIQNRTLFFGDSLKILEERIPDEIFDLIYLDPPFNSDRNYNVLFKEGQSDSSAQIHAFEDTWEWTPATNSMFEDLKKNPHPQIALLIASLAEFIGTKNPMMAYLVNMTARLTPLRRVLKPTGSIYLHCDPTASHYLKIMMDVIFGKEHFINEIVWYYDTGGRAKRYFPKKHDTILWYAKGDDYIFNYDAVSLERDTSTMHEPVLNDEQGRPYQRNVKFGKEYRYYLDKGVLPNDWWSDLQALNPASKERLGYPTQKPEALLERIIQASSNENSWILDPFCGCGTTVAVAERLNRKWVGIDISMQAITVIQNRLQTHYPGIKITIDGIPMDYESAAQLAQQDKYAFQDWAISLVGANPPSGEARKGADRGIDGLILFHEAASFDNPKPKLRKILVQVKGGGTGRGDVAKLKGDMERDSAPMGILISLHEPTQEMEREAALAGEYKYSDPTSYPKIQLLSIKEWFSGKTIKLPSDIINPFRKAEAKADQESLL